MPWVGFANRIYWAATNVPTATVADSKLAMKDRDSNLVAVGFVVQTFLSLWCQLDECLFGFVFLWIDLWRFVVINFFVHWSFPQNWKKEKEIFELAWTDWIAVKHFIETVRGWRKNEQSIFWENHRLEIALWRWMNAFPTDGRIMIYSEWIRTEWNGFGMSMPLVPAILINSECTLEIKCVRKWAERKHDISCEDFLFFSRDKNRIWTQRNDSNKHQFELRKAHWPMNSPKI